MALDARAMLPAAAAAAGSAVDVGEERPWSGNGGDGGGGGGDSSPAVAMDLLAMWGDERRMKRELVAWAKAVASMAIRESMQY
ncbi:uncharacterized protein LOC107304087 [Oryza brachyantha]|uniref:uncharacterized protein LOC107304087 n=1 Tax=Oryza brachyantha TaxID=4533 RepID=UPI001ADAB4AA|nr:uncharacterized protein LOC107304087 [Oryza brachyantha]